jgi:predicted DNA-binding transcriptional regulator YafY
MNVVSTENEWLTLNEYSSEYGVSVSTLRRRIKAKQIKFKLIQGKYYLPKHSLPPQKEAFAPVPATKSSSNSGNHKQDENTFQTARVLLDELKKAYLQSLQSKEDQIIQLKQQITDLKTLVMYLERENSRLNPKSF